MVFVLCGRNYRIGKMILLVEMESAPTRSE